MSTPLAQKIKALIAEQGPITIADYFAICLADPEFGYYRAREPFGRAGDFITAPEISQLFGEMIGVFLVHAWEGHRRPEAVRLVEIGPGRGTLMADALRIVERLAPNLLAGLNVHLVETSERLRNIQRQALVRHGRRVHWHDDFSDVPEGFTLLVANEFFDAIPLRQFVNTPEGFRERVVMLDGEGELAFGLGATGIDPSLLPRGGADAPAGAIFEAAPARTAIMLALAERLVQHGGTTLIVDYGHLITNYGDTLQAMRQHDFDPPLAHPGEADLTSHVDFEALVHAALAAGAHVHRPLTQGDFLLGLGIRQRAGRLGAGKDAVTQATLQDAVNRLAGEGAGRMGQLFKVLAISGRPLGLEPFEVPAN